MVNRITINDQFGEKNYNWKGNKVQYAGLHYYMNRILKKPDVCSECGQNKFLDLANINVYNREKTNWKYLCRSCHMKLDYKLGKRSFSKEKRKKLFIGYQKYRKKVSENRD
jgi:hypothetical protein